MREHIFWSRAFGQLAAGAFTALVAASAQAEVVDSSANGFTVRETAHIAAPSDKVYAALVQVGHWWSSKHTFSGDAANLTLDAKAGGCWCEMLPGGGSVLHMTVVDVEPNKTLRLRGAMGPFQAMAVETVMTWTLVPANGGTDVTLVNTAGGYTKDGLEPISKVADMVFSEQLSRLKSYVETGSPEAGKETKP